MENKKLEKFYTCRYDPAFKEVFMNEKNKGLLICLLEEILEVKINELEYLNLERLSDNVHIYRKHFDLNLKTDKGYIQVEVNAYPEKYIRPRNTAYICDQYSHYVLRGDTYSEEKKIIQINFTYKVKSANQRSIFMLRDEEGKTFVSNFLIYEFYMDNYLKLWYSKDKKEIEKNKHLIMLDLEPKELTNLSQDDKVVKEYMEEITRVNQDPEFREYMSAEEDNRKIENSLKASWLEEGVKQGLEQGVKQGLEQGSKEASLKIAKEFLNMGVSKEKISKATGLSIEELEKL